MYFLTNLLFFGIPLLYYYTNFSSSIICCLFSGDIYLSFSISNSLLTLSKLFCEDLFKCNYFEKLVILSSILLLPNKSPVASAAFWIALFEAVFIAFVVDFLVTLVACATLSRSFSLYLALQFPPIF